MVRLRGLLAVPTWNTPPDQRINLHNEGTYWIAWAKKMADYGAGEILLTSMDRDGTRDGYDLVLTRAVVDAIPIPVVASGGVGTLGHVHEGLTAGGADAALAASIFHDGHYTVAEVKGYLLDQGVCVRPPERD